MLRWFKPSEHIHESDVRHSMRMVMGEGIFAHLMLVYTTGAFLVAFGLVLGANNIVIGLLAAIGPATQVLQIPAIYLVERVRMRKVLTLVLASIGRLALIGVALTPWLIPAEYRVEAFLGFLAAHFGFGALAGCALNSWLRDLVPTSVMGSFFGKRLAFATFAGGVLSLIAGIAIDVYGREYGDPTVAYTVLFIVGSVFGMTGVFFQFRTHEPKMPPRDTTGVFAVLKEPFRDANFRKLLIFMAWWSFAINIAWPFAVVYLIKRLDMSMGWVLGLVVFSQMVNVIFFPLWGRVADRFSNRSVIMVAGPLFLAGFLLWPFTTMPEQHAFTIPLLFLIHLLAGVTIAGVNLCVGNIAWELAPSGKSTAYLAVNALVIGLTATAAPILAGFAADWLETEMTTLTLTVVSTTGEHGPLDVPTASIKGLDYLFIVGFLIGLYAMHRLLAVKEEGDTHEEAVREALFLEMRRAVRGISTVPGIRQLMYMPSALGRRKVKAPALPTDTPQDTGVAGS